MKKSNSAGLGTIRASGRWAHVRRLSVSRWVATFFSFSAFGLGVLNTSGAVGTLATVSTLALSSTTAQAQEYRPHRGYRYRTTYREWDRAIHTRYGYYEERCEVSYSYGRRYYSCYEMAPTSYVYVEERVFSNGYRRVIVYRDAYGNSPYATYYVYNGRVERRDFWGHRYYRDPYYSPYYYQTNVWVQLNWDNGFDKVIVGSYTALVGVGMVLDARNGTEAVIGGIVALLGSASVSSGTEQMHEESELQKQLREDARRDSQLR